MATRSKNYRKAAERIHDGEIYAPLQAVRLAKETATTKFDSTVEVVFRLVDPARQTRWCAAPSTCRTAPARPLGSWSSPS
nr:hypothetical protein DA06_31870 [Georgenia sp. SUBG003]